MSNDFVTKRTTLPSPEKLFTEMFETGDPDHTQPSMLTDIHHDSPVLHKKDLNEQEEQIIPSVLDRVAYIVNMGLLGPEKDAVLEKFIEVLKGKMLKSM